MLKDDLGPNIGHLVGLSSIILPDFEHSICNLGHSNNFSQNNFEQAWAELGQAQPKFESETTELKFNFKKIFNWVKVLSPFAHVNV